MQLLPFFYKAHSGRYTTKFLCDEDENIQDNWKELVGRKAIPISEPDEWWHISIESKDGEWTLHAENTHNLQYMFRRNEIDDVIHVASFLGPLDMSRILTTKMSEIYPLKKICDRGSHRHIQAVVPEGFHRHWCICLECAEEEYLSPTCPRRHMLQKNKIQLICEGIIQDTIDTLTEQLVEYTGIQYDFEYNNITN